MLSTLLSIRIELLSYKKTYLSIASTSSILKDSPREVRMYFKFETSMQPLPSGSKACKAVSLSLSMLISNQEKHERIFKLIILHKVSHFLATLNNNTIKNRMTNGEACLVTYSQRTQYFIVAVSHKVSFPLTENDDKHLLENF